MTNCWQVPYGSTAVLWYCGTTVVPWPRRCWYREKEVPRFHGSTVVPPNTKKWCTEFANYACRFSIFWRRIL